MQLILVITKETYWSGCLRLCAPDAVARIDRSWSNTSKVSETLFKNSLCVRNLSRNMIQASQDKSNDRHRVSKKKLVFYAKDCKTLTGKHLSVKYAAINTNWNRKLSKLQDALPVAIASTKMSYLRYLEYSTSHSMLKNSTVPAVITSWQKPCWSSICIQLSTNG